ncbi:MAG: hypothetical protein ACJAVV_002183 [Alphaproteobacteria bacterium]
MCEFLVIHCPIAAVYSYHKEINLTPFENSARFIPFICLYYKLLLIISAEVYGPNLSISWHQRPSLLKMGLYA